jgi:hypothetical protein
MIGKTYDKKNILVLIEWKYTEGPNEYKGKFIDNINRPIYDEWLKKEDCPIKIVYFDNLYYEPYYQLMRQTLLGWQMAEKLNEFDCKEYIHLQIVPKKNAELLSINTSPKLFGENMHDKWRNILDDKHKKSYNILHPDGIFETLRNEESIQLLLKYLQKRYW